MSVYSRKKIAIVGAGGAGLCAAWLLRHKYDITLLEKKNYLGGHAHTLYMEGDDGFSTCAVDTAFRLFHPQKNPTLGRYFSLLGVPIRNNHLVAGVKTYKTVNGEDRVVDEVVAPPFHNLGYFFKTLRKPWVLKAATLYSKALKEHKKRVKSGATQSLGVPVNEILGSYSGSYKPLNRLLYPMVTAAFVGSTYEDIPRYDFDNFVEFLHESKATDPFKIEYSSVIGGVSVYADMVQNILLADNRVRVINNCPIATVQKAASNKKRHVVSKDGTFNEEFDEVVMAVPPNIVLNTIPDLTESVREVLGMVELVNTRTLVHKDLRYAISPETYMTFHAFEDRRTNFLVGRPLFVQGRRDSIFTTTAKKEQIDPSMFNNVEHVFDRYGYALTPMTIHARNLLPSIQGVDNVWLCGAWGAGHYSHEGCITTAVHVAERLGMDEHPLK